MTLEEYYNANDENEIGGEIERTKSGEGLNNTDNIDNTNKEEQAGTTGLLGEKQRNGSDENSSRSISDETS